MGKVGEGRGSLGLVSSSTMEFRFHIFYWVKFFHDSKDWTLGLSLGGRLMTKG